MSDKPGQSLKNKDKITKEEMDELAKKIETKNDPMKLEEIQKWLKDKGIIDETKITQKDLDRIYAKMEGRAMDFSTFMQELGKETKADMMDIYAKIVAAIPERETVSKAINSKKDSALKSIKELEGKVEEYAKSNTEISLAKMHEWFSGTEVTTEPPSNSKEIKMKKEDLKKFLEEIPSEEKLNIEEFRMRYNEWVKKKDSDTK